MRRSAVKVALVVQGVVLFTAVCRTGERPEASEILASGTIEATEVEVAARIPERIEAVFVREGDRVENGGLLIRLETLELDLQVKVANTRVAMAQGQLQDLLAGAREQELKDAEAALDRAEAECRRGRRRIGRGFEPCSGKERSRKAYRDAAQADLANATGRQQRAREGLDLLRAGDTNRTGSKWPGSGSKRPKRHWRLPGSAGNTLKSPPPSRAPSCSAAWSPGRWPWLAFPYSPWVTWTSSG